MNEYSRTAWRYWRVYRPQALADLPEPEAFFTNLGDQAEELETSLWLDLQEAALAESGTEDYEVRLGLSNMARMQAKEKVRAELIYLEKEEGTEHLELPA
ncbi:TnpV protein [Kitasatospora sp. CB02891]|uniref:TnpV protein n=1 Tax=Kitasatospora sp. CB02891 TaxID=2020329 RepID=UPI000C26F3EC|nr:TnpV protein [Kitasatospora sp. CB02891]PJN21148.1 TnpV protein [Kitasatospora sp. CB02891]